MNRLHLFCATSLLALALALSPAPAEPIEVKVMAITTFEVGKDSGDKIGEYQPWVEGAKLDQEIPLPAAYHALRTNGKGLFATYTGMGGNRSAASIMALGLDPRFDLTKTYFIVGGIAGVNPHVASLGSAAWANYVVSSDLAHFIDPREMPKDWKSGFFPLNSASQASAQKTGPGYSTNADSVVFQLNASLVEWAYATSKSTVLPDDKAMQTNRARFTGYPNAQKPPFVLIGDTVSGNTFWHGQLMNGWASDWVKYWTKDQGIYVTTAMEDVGMLQAFTWLAKAGKIDRNRVLVLRTASNYDMQPPALTAAESLAQEENGYYSGFEPSCRAHYLVGGKVAAELLAHWDLYRDRLPPPRPQ